MDRFIAGPIRRSGAVTLTAATLLLVCAPVSAVAAEAWRSGSKVSYRADPGEANSLTVSKVRGHRGTGKGRAVSLLKLTDRTAVIRAGAGCSSDSAHVVVCPAEGIRVLVVQAGDGDDEVTNATATRAHLAGGDGNDRVIGGFGADTIRGGRGEDFQSGRGGDDAILSRGNFADRVLCGGGHDSVAADSLDDISAACEAVGLAAAPPQGDQRRIPGG